MDKHYTSPLRFKRGAATLAALAANFNTISIFNDGAGQFLLLIHDITVAASAASSLQAGYNKGAVGAVAGAQVTLIPEATQLPGTIYTQQAAAIPGTVTAYWGASTSAMSPWTHEFPFAVLPPGWAYWVSSAAVNQALTVDFVWECVYMGNIQPPDDVTELYEEVAQRLQSGQ